MQIITETCLSDLVSKNMIEKSSQDKNNTRVSEIFETDIMHSFRVYNHDGRNTLRFYQFKKQYNAEQYFINVYFKEYRSGLVDFDKLVNNIRINIKRNWNENTIEKLREYISGILSKNDTILDLGEIVNKIKAL